MLALAGDDLAVFEPVELVGDRRELLQDRPTPGLAGVGGEDRADQRPVEVLGDLVGVDPAVPELAQGRFGALVDPGGVVLAEVGADGADAGLLLGQVDQVEVDAEGADQGPEVGQAELTQAVAEPPGLLQRGVRPEVLRRRPDLLDEVERVLARQSPDRLAEQAAERVDVVAESFQGLGPHDGSARSRGGEANLKTPGVGSPMASRFSLSAIGPV